MKRLAVILGLMTLPALAQLPGLATDVFRGSIHRGGEAWTDFELELAAAGKARLMRVERVRNVRDLQVFEGNWELLRDPLRIAFLPEGRDEPLVFLPDGDRLVFAGNDFEIRSNYFDIEVD